MRIAAKDVRVTVDSQVFCLQVPADPESQMASLWEHHGEKDVLFPFWLEIWPSAFGLWSFFASRDIPLDGALEVGCGSGILAQMLRKQRGTLWHSDLLPEAVDFARRAVLSLGEVANRRFLCMDAMWPALKTRPRVLFGSDLLYEDRLVRAVAAAVRDLLADDGVFWLADPLRHWRCGAPDLLRSSGVQIQEHPWEFLLDGRPVRIAVYQLSKL